MNDGGVRRVAGVEEIPGAIVVATVVPLAAKAGTAGVIAVGVTVVAMVMRRNEFLAVALGLTAISLARAYGI